MWQILLILAVIVTAIGFGFLSQATMGVGIIAIGCVLGILARIAQANAQHNELKAILGSLGSKPQNQVLPAPTQLKNQSKFGGLNDDLFSEPKNKE